MSESDWGMTILLSSFALFPLVVKYVGDLLVWIDERSKKR